MIGFLEQIQAETIRQDRPEEILALPGEPRELLQPIFRHGKLVYDRPPLDVSRALAIRNVAEFKDREWPVGLQTELWNLKQKLIADARS